MISRRNDQSVQINCNSNHPNTNRPITEAILNKNIALNTHITVVDHQTLGEEAGMAETVHPPVNTTSAVIGVATAGGVDHNAEGLTTTITGRRARGEEEGLSKAAAEDGVSVGPPLAEGVGGDQVAEGQITGADVETNDRRAVSATLMEAEAVTLTAEAETSEESGGTGEITTTRHRWLKARGTIGKRTRPGEVEGIFDVFVVTTA